MALKQTLRIALDIAMTVVLIIAYSNRIIGDSTHKLVGIGIIFLFTTHLIINGHWITSIFKGVFTSRRILMTAVNVLLALVAITMVLTGMLEAFWTSSFLRFDIKITAREIHTTAAYWFLPLIGVHLGLHWGMFSKYIGKNLFVITIMRILAFMFFMFGVWSFFNRDMFAKMFLGFSFDYWPQEKPLILFFAETLSIMGIFVFAIYYLTKLFAWLKSGNKK